MKRKEKRMKSLSDSDYRSRIDELKSKYLSAKQRLEIEEKSLIGKKKELKASGRAQQFFISIAGSIQQKIHESISSIVCSCLDFVFDDPYEFEIKFSTSKGKTEAVLVMRRGGKEFYEPVREVGVGTIDVASLGLRIANIMLSRPRKRRILILDEPFKNVRGRRNKARLRDLLLMLSEKMGFQFILNVDVEAYPEFALGKIVEINK